MRKLKVICFLFDPNIGGPTIRARNVYERMIADGYDVRIAFPNGKGSAAEFIAEKGIPVDKLSIEKPVLPRKFVMFLKFSLKVPASIFRVRRYLRQEKPDVIHVNGAFDVVPALAGILARVPVVWHLNDTVLSPRFSRKLGWVVKKVASVVVVAATRVGEHYNVMDAATHVIFAPVDVSKFDARDPNGFPRANSVLTLIGNWNWIKGHDRFVEVVAGLLGQGIKVRGFMVGKFLEGQRAYWEPILDRIATDNLDRHFECPGFVEDTAGVLEDSDILLLTSHSEASPMSLLEAMSVGVPVVTFDVGGVREMLGTDENGGAEAAGVVVPNGDVDAMQKAAANLLKDPERYQQMCWNGQNRARERFSLESCVERHIEAYAEATN
ncbi:glycosyltransferase family 4 protein [Planktotalea sp.]|uniref:glycosyltransferase family 4 protein n=1 Tax=Planktotalea sp. TaxID=2029877 RepID=UPI0035C857F2